MRRTFTVGFLLVLAGGFLTTAADVRIIGFEAASLGLVLLILGLGVGIAGELTGLEEDTRVAALGLAATVVVSLGVLAVLGGIIPALLVGLVMAIGVGYLLSRRKVLNNG